MRAIRCVGLTLLSVFCACGGEGSAPRPPGPPAAPASPWAACLRASALEGVARETVPQLDLRIEGVRVVTGALGQRGADVDASGDVLRIAAVGGELTFGVGLSAEEAWPQALAAQLNHTLLSGGRRAEALNLGTVEASVTDLVGLARLRALGWQPWILVLELDASRLGETPSDTLRERLDALRKASAEALCGVLVAVGAPPDGRWEAAHRLLTDEAQRAGFSTLDLRQLVPGPEHDAQVHGRVLEAVKRRIYDSGLLTAALESH
jgi:hypothetical protein